MQSVCQLRLYTDDGRLLTGRPRVLRSSELSSSQSYNTSPLLPKAMSVQSSAVPENHTPSIHKKHKSSQKRPARSFQQRGNDNKRPFQSSPLLEHQYISSDPPEAPNTEHPLDQPSNSMSLDTQHPTQRKTYQMKPVEDPSQLSLILAKLNELDDIKTHLNTIDTRLNLLQPQIEHLTTVAKRS